MATVKAHVFITGQVQGVGFRFYACQEANALQLSGWVRNVKSSKFKMKNSKLTEFTGVEAVFEGEEQNVREMIAWCWEGAPTAQVSEVQVQWEAPGGLVGFETRPTV